MRASRKRRSDSAGPWMSSPGSWPNSGSHFGEPALAVATPHLERPHSILRHHETLGEEEVRGVLRIDVRHTKGVAYDLARLTGTGDHDGPIDLGEGGPGKSGRGGRRCALSRDITEGEDREEEGGNNR